MSRTIFTTRALAIFPAALLAVLLCGCEQKTQEVGWYKEHDAERMERIRDCKADPDGLGKSQDCTNAKQAQREILNPR